MSPSPHDRLFRTVFQHLEHARGWLASRLSGELAALLPWERLQRRPEHLPVPGQSGFAADLVFAVPLPGAWPPLLVLVEHKSHRDHFAAEQLLRYAVLLRRAERTRAKRHPALLLALVLHHGPLPFAEPAHPQLDALPPLLAAFLAPRQPRLVHLLDDLTTTDEAALRARAMTPMATLTLLALRSLPGSPGHTVPAAIARWGDLLRAVDRSSGTLSAADALAAFACYVVEVTDVLLEDLDLAFADHLHVHKETTMTTAERLRAEGRAKGLREGHREGHREGLATGRNEGRAALLRLQLEQRFGLLPSAVVARLGEATAAELERFAVRVLDARTLSDVFDG